MKKEIEKYFGVKAEKVTPHLFNWENTYFMATKNDKENFEIVKAIIKKNPELLPSDFIQAENGYWEITEPEEGETEGRAKLKLGYENTPFLGVTLGEVLLALENPPSLEIKREGLACYIKIKNLNTGGIDILKAIE